MEKLKFRTENAYNAPDSITMRITGDNLCVPSTSETWWFTYQIFQAMRAAGTHRVRMSLSKTTNALVAKIFVAAVITLKDVIQGASAVLKIEPLNGERWTSM